MKTIKVWESAIAERARVANTSARHAKSAEFAGEDHKFSGLNHFRYVLTVGSEIMNRPSPR
jgi:hypothetical protein